MKMKIRKATSTDLEALMAIARRTIAASYGPFLGSHVVAGFIESDASNQYVGENAANCSVIAVDGAVAGFFVSARMI